MHMPSQSAREHSLMVEEGMVGGGFGPTAMMTGAVYNHQMAAATAKQQAVQRPSGLQTMNERELLPYRNKIIGTEE